MGKCRDRRIVKSLAVGMVLFATKQMLAAPATTSVPYSTLFDPRINQVDVRLAKSLTFGRTRVQLTASVYNLTNTNAAMVINNQYSATWLQPKIIMQGRLIKFGFQLDY